MLKSKKNNPFNTPKTKAHCLKVGQISYLWNLLHVTMFLIFVHLFDKDKEPSLKALWVEAGTDTAQRRLIKIYISALPTSDFLEELNWLLDCVNNHSQYRNALVHVPMLEHIEENSFVPLSFAARQSYVEKINHMYEKNIFPKLKKDLLNLNDFAWQLLRAHAGKIELPERPLLQAYPNHQGDGRKKSRHRNNTTPPHQRGLLFALSGRKKR